MENLWDLMYYNNKRIKNNSFNIIRNISNILNTRSSLPLAKFIGIKNLSTIYFGLPSFTHLSMESEKDRKILCQTIEKSIQTFEHRLSFVEVEFSHYDHLKKEAKLSVKAVYINNDILVNLVLKIAFWEFIVNDWQS